MASTGSNIGDDDATVDSRKKQQILDRREELDEWEMELYTQVGLGEMSIEQANQLWGYRVRSYLKAVEPILVHGDLEHQDQVYQEQDCGQVQIPAPSEFRSSRFEITGDPPTPKRVPVQGIREVIEAKQVSATWEVQVRDQQSGERRKMITRSNSRALTYPVLETAVRVVDEWLQVVGIGIDTNQGVPEYGFEEVEDADETP